MSHERSKTDENPSTSWRWLAIGLLLGATALVAGVVLARRFSVGRPTQFRVSYGDRQWVVAASRGDLLETYGTKRAAVAAGREKARDNAPSELLIYRSDGSLQRHHRYSG